MTKDEAKRRAIQASVIAYDAGASIFDAGVEWAEGQIAAAVRAERVRIADELARLSAGPQSWESFKGGVVNLIDELRGEL